MKIHKGLILLLMSISVQRKEEIHTLKEKEGESTSFEVD